jgi:phenylalanyl-tRNA synthetase alpha chain
VKELQQQFEHELLDCQSVDDIEALKLKYLGRKGAVQEQMRYLKDLKAEERADFGARINALKAYIEEKIEQFFKQTLERQRSEQMAQEHIDVTLPGRSSWKGSYHPVAATMQSIVRIFKDLGFSVQIGPQVESDYYNFEVLNFAEDHPAKDMQDTFYIEPGVLLRTHTSNAQGRVMERTSPPIRIISPGKCFRNEEVSARSHVFFHQIEGLIRFRPSYFPFVEPGAEVDASCLVCSGKGCQLCKYTGWLELGGTGMVHPQVLRNVGIDPEKYQGYAWGFGIERMVMLRHTIKDIRLFSENDMRFLRQFPAI